MLEISKNGDPRKTSAASKILTPEASRFITELHENFGQSRIRLLQARQERQTQISRGVLPAFLPDTQNVRSRDWKVAACPPDLLNRQVEITGPAEAKMIINALNSSAKVFMADFEDSLSPTWKNILDGQSALYDAVRKKLEFKNTEGKSYQLKPDTATLKVRPRGWHLTEKNFLIQGTPISASLFDFGIFFFHNAAELLKRGSGPYFYLPKMESHLEARLWNDVFTFSQKRLGIPHGSIRATVLIETILAAFEMDEILYELRDHASGLNAGRWDYIFSLIKKFRDQRRSQLPDRSQITMGVPFMSAYARLLVATCHRRQAHAMGGMSAFIPSRKDAQVNEVAFQKVREDKKREATLGFDGTWIAHPDLAAIAQAEFTSILGDRPHQVDRPADTTPLPTAADLIDTQITGAQVTEEGIRSNLNVALQYLSYWLSGTGAAAIHNLMEDAATAEISRALLWKWRREGQKTDTGKTFTAEWYRELKAQEIQKLGDFLPGFLKKAEALLDDLVLKDEFPDFLTLPAYAWID